MGNRSGTITLTDNGPGGMQSVALTGVGTAQPMVSFSPSSLNFGGVLANVPSPAYGSLNITINVANAPLTLQNISLSSAMFSTQNSCPPVIAAGANCEIAVFFAPTVLGPVSAAMHFQDDASNSPQSIPLTGIGSHFELTPITDPGSIIAGQSASFQVGFVTAASFNETVAITCSTTAPMSTCVFAPTSLPVDGTVQNINVTLTTTARSFTGFRIFSSPDLRGLRIYRPLWFAFAVFFCGVALAITRRKHAKPLRGWALLAMICACVLAATVVSCGGGGGGNSGGSNPSSGTPAGNYTITVVGTSSNPANPPISFSMPFQVQ